jgi:glycopeptide antibiotics resistance protein
VGWLRDRRVLVALVVAYAVALVMLVVAPWGWALNRLTVALYVQFRYDWPLAPDAAVPEHYGMLLNVLLFVPLGVLGALLTGRAWWWVTLAGALGSVMVELAQRQWLERDASAADVVANTLGALVGAVAVSLLARRGSRRAGRPASPRRP